MLTFDLLVKSFPFFKVQSSKQFLGIRKQLFSQENELLKKCFFHDQAVIISHNVIVVYILVLNLFNLICLNILPTIVSCNPLSDGHMFGVKKTAFLCVH